MNISYKDNNICIEGVEEFKLDATFDCGQCFRWDSTGDKFSGIIFGRHFNISERSKGIEIENSDKQDLEMIKDYFDLNTDYRLIREKLSRIHPNLKKSCDFSKGIRILKQDPWEALCSFIISQNNNIPRIKKIIFNLCLNFGDKIDENYYSFPSYSKIARLKEEELSIIRSGFRAKYILDAARKIENGNIIIDNIKHMSIEEARIELKKILGVGPKVAECTLLYGFHRLEAFPIDTWIKRAMNTLFPDINEEEFGEYKGVAQQYIFYYSRMNPNLFK